MIHAPRPMRRFTVVPTGRGVSSPFTTSESAAASTEPTTTAAAEPSARSVTSRPQPSGTIEITRPLCAVHARAAILIQVCGGVAAQWKTCLGYREIGEPDKSVFECDARVAFNLERAYRRRLLVFGKVRHRDIERHVLLVGPACDLRLIQDDTRARGRHVGARPAFIGARIQRRRGAL